MKNLIISILIVIVYPFICNANIVRIPQDFPTIQEGINSATAGDTILVAPGIYTDTHKGSLNGYPIDVCISMRSGVVVMSEMGPDFTTVTNDTAIAVVLIDNVADTSAVLQGFTIQGSWWGILCINVSAPLITDNIIIPMIPGSAGDGLGVAIGDSSGALIRNNIFRDHELAVLIEGASPRFENNLFSNNQKGLQIEGGFTFHSSMPLIHQNLFRNNETFAISSYTDEADFIISENIFEENRRGIVIEDGKVLASKNTFVANQYGIEVHSSQPASEVLFLNNTLYGDSIGFRSVADSQLIYNTIFRNTEIAIDSSSYWGTPFVNYSNIDGGWPGVGNIAADPRFIHPDTLNFQLHSNSPCVDAGSDTVFTLRGDTLIITDFEGSKPDMGALESPWVTTINTDRNESFRHFFLYSNYPNPFNPSTTISYHIPKRSRVILKIYNMLGEEITTLVNRYESAGLKSVIWNGKDNNGNNVASGIYFYRLHADHFVKTKRAVLVK